jgi:hypothetical protein
MAHYILDKAYKITNKGGVPAGRVVVQGDLDGECILPAAANAGAILGVTVYSTSVQNQNVAVRKAGIAHVEAAGPILAGEPVNIADWEGRVKRVDELGKTKINCLGFAETSAAEKGDAVEVFISLHERTA